MGEKEYPAGFRCGECHGRGTVIARMVETHEIDVCDDCAGTGWARGRCDEECLECGTLVPWGAPFWPWYCAGCADKGAA